MFLETRRKRDILHTVLDHRRYINVEWSHLDHDLHRECAIFGPVAGSELNKWQLDEREGPSRMRKLLRPNPKFYRDYPPSRTDTRSSSAGADHGEMGGAGGGAGAKASPTSEHSGGYTSMRREEKTNPLLLSSVWTVRRPSKLWDTADTTAGKTTTNAGGGEDEDEDEDQGEEDSEDQLILQILEPGDKRMWEVEAAQATGLDADDGVFIFCNNAAYFAPGYGLTSRGKIFRRPREEQPDTAHGDAVVKWAFEDVRDIRRRRYCLQDLALEMFSVDGMNSMLVFNDRPIRDKVYDAVIGVASTLTNTAKESVDGMQRDAKLEREGTSWGTFAWWRSPADMGDDVCTS